MNPLQRAMRGLDRSLGNRGAVANCERALRDDHRHRAEVEQLVARLARRDRVALAAAGSRDRAPARRR